MARGKYLSLEEARKAGTIKQFCKEHPSTGDGEMFDNLFSAMAGEKSDGKSRNRKSRQPRQPKR